MEGFGPPIGFLLLPTYAQYAGNNPIMRVHPDDSYIEVSGFTESLVGG
jgi:hypothetical protein